LKLKKYSEDISELNCTKDTEDKANADSEIRYTCTISSNHTISEIDDLVFVMNGYGYSIPGFI